MSVDNLLSRLDRVRKTGPSEWVACCPAHDSSSKSSLAIKEAADGRVLIHDFGGCSALDVLDAVGLDFADLFPERITDDAGRRKTNLAPRTALIAIAHDVTEAAVIVSDVAEGRTEPGAMRLHLWTLAGRMASALSMAGCANG
ncbi:MAG TPA: hypothetical protein VGE10_00530 [Zeimonas sp.]